MEAQRVRRRRGRGHLYVWECMTLHGFVYRGYSNSLDYPPGNSTGNVRVNLNK